MKKRRLRFLVVNLIAILAVAGSVFLPWWLGMRPYDVTLTDLATLDFLDNLNFEPTLALVVFAGAAVVILGALLTFKWLVLIGIAIEVATAVTWWFSLGIGFIWNDFGYGIYLLAGGILLSVFSLFIRRRREEKKK